MRIWKELTIMFLTSYNYGIRLIDLVDYTNPDTTFSDVISKVNELLTLNCKDEFYVLDDEVFTQLRYKLMSTWYT